MCDERRLACSCVAAHPTAHFDVKAIIASRRNSYAGGRPACCAWSHLVPEQYFFGFCCRLAKGESSCDNGGPLNPPNACSRPVLQWSAYLLSDFVKVPLFLHLMVLFEFRRNRSRTKPKSTLICRAQETAWTGDQTYLDSGLKRKMMLLFLYMMLVFGFVHPIVCIWL